MDDKVTTSTPTIVALSCCLLGLIVLLIFLYKKLNKESDGEYTIRNIVFKEGGLRDRVRGAAIVLGTRLGVQLWPHSDSQEHVEEMQEIQDEEGQVDESSSQESDSEEGEQEEEEEEEDSVEQSSETKGKGDDNSSLEDSDLEEKASLMNKGETEGKEKGKGGDGKGEPSGGGGLQININQLSGSVIWFEDEGGKANVSDVTAL